jgi:hypothetical protein
VRYIKIIAVVFALSMLAALVGCSSGSSSGGGGGNNPISVSLSGAPASLVVNATASVTATVANDSAGAGVTWTCAPSAACGSFNPTSTGSGTATTYTAPASVPSGGSVTVTATSVTDSTKSKSATITITQPAIALADGNYVFSLAGSNTNGVAYNVAGVLKVASGAITGGEQDYIDATPTGDLHDEINPTGSSFTTTSDGNLQITLNTCLVQDCTKTDTVIGGGSGAETINGSIITASTCGTAGGPCVAKIVEFDTFATSTGALELQDTAAAATAPAGGYAFAVEGVPSLTDAVGGILNVSGTTVSTTGTVIDLNLGGVVSKAQAISAGSVGTVDATGRFQLSLTTAAATLNFASYIVDADHIQLVGASFPVGGVALSQSTPTASGNTYVVGLNGADGVGPLQAAGALSLASGATGVTGTVSYNDLVNLQSAAIGVTGTYTTDAANPGRYTLDSLTDGTNTFDLALYVDGKGNALMISLSAGVVLEGVGNQQASGTFSGTYVMDSVGYDGSTNALQLDAVGPVTTGTGTFSGFADLNWLGATTPNLTVSGAFTSPSNGVSTGTGNTVTGLDVLLGTSQADAFDYYVVDSTKVIAIEIDSNQNTLATFDMQQ